MMRPSEHLALGHSQTSGGVVLIHGHGRTGRSMRVLARRLQRAGYTTCAPDYRSFNSSLPEVAEQLLPDLLAFQAEVQGPLHIVSHSLGGLVARALIHAHRPQRLERVVMLAPPNAGSEWADLSFRLRLNRMVLGPAAGHLRTRRSQADEAIFGQVDFELGVIAGDRPLDPVFPRLVLPWPNDGKVSVASTRVAGMADHMTLPTSHTFMINNGSVADQVLAFLKTGCFMR